MTIPRPIRVATEGTIEVPRTARFYEMGSTAGNVDEIWFVLHGFGQLARDFIQYFADVAQEARLVIAPEALNRYYATGSTSSPATERTVGATWMTREDRQNEIVDYVRYLDLLHDRYLLRYARARTVVVGFSQGGATAARWALQGRTLIDRLILWGATVPPDAQLDAQAFRGTPLTIVAGHADQYITPAALVTERARLTKAGVSYDVVGYAGGHSIKRAVLKSLTH